MTTTSKVLLATLTAIGLLTATALFAIDFSAQRVLVDGPSTTPPTTQSTVLSTVPDAVPSKTTPPNEPDDGQVADQPTTETTADDDNQPTFSGPTADGRMPNVRGEGT